MKASARHTIHARKALMARNLTGPQIFRKDSPTFRVTSIAFEVSNH